MHRIARPLFIAGSLCALASPATAQLSNCQPQEPVESLADRPSPYDSLRIDLGDQQLLVCYGRPSSRGRTMIGGDLVPYGSLWRTGANEPTILHIPFAATVAGIEVDAGSYSLYTVPGETSWTIVVNRSIDHWGHESQYTPEVEAQEVGRSTVTPGSTDAHVEMFSITGEPGSDSMDALLVLQWEGTRVEIPIQRR